MSFFNGLVWGAVVTLLFKSFREDYFNYLNDKADKAIYEYRLDKLSKGKHPFITYNFVIPFHNFTWDLRKWRMKDIFIEPKYYEMIKPYIKKKKK